MKHRGMLRVSQVHSALMGDETQSETWEGQKDRGGGTHHAKDPMRDTNLSSSRLPAHETSAQNTTTPARNTFFCHLTAELCFPDLEKMPFSMMRTAGKSCSGAERRIARQSAS